MSTDHEPWTTDPAIRDDDDLRGVLDVLAARAAAPVPPEVRHAHVGAVLAEAASRGSTGRRSTRRRVRQVLALTGVKVVLAGGIAAAGTTTGLATTGTLPDPVQQWAHEVGARIGVGLPAAPGQLAKSDGDPDSTGKDHAPGQLKRGDPGQTGRDTAPGQVGRDVVPPTPPDAPTGPPDDVEAPGRSGDAPGRSRSTPGSP